MGFLGSLFPLSLDTEEVALSLGIPELHNRTIQGNFILILALGAAG